MPEIVLPVFGIGFLVREAFEIENLIIVNPFEPMLKTVEQMAVVSGIGENRLRQLMDNGELEFIQNGNRRLISEQAIWDYYNRAKTPARSVSGGC